jgi:tRNA 2-selenouridine synthase
MDPGKPLWLEDESLMIGRVRIPDALFACMRQAMLFFADMPLEERAARLVVDYGRFPKNELEAATKRIEKRLGPQHCKAALEALATDDLLTVATITLRYYDKAYLRGASERDPEKMVRIPATSSDLRGLASRLLEHAAASSPVH